MTGSRRRKGNRRTLGEVPLIGSSSEGEQTKLKNPSEYTDEELVEVTRSETTKAIGWLVTWRGLKEGLPSDPHLYLIGLWGEIYNRWGDDAKENLTWLFGDDHSREEEANDQRRTKEV